MADAADVMRILQPNDADAVFLRALDADVHRLLGDDLAIAGAPLDHDHCAIVAVDLGVVVALAGACRGVLDVVRHHADAVAVVAE